MTIDKDNLTIEQRVLVYMRLRVEQTKRVPDINEIGDFLNLPYDEVRYAYDTVVAWLILTSKDNIDIIVKK